MTEGSKKVNGISEVKWESWHQNLRYFLSVLFLLFSVAYFLSIFYIHTIGHHAVHMMICYSIQIIFYMPFFFRNMGIKLNNLWYVVVFQKKRLIYLYKWDESLYWRTHYLPQNFHNTFITNSKCRLLLVLVWNYHLNYTFSHLIYIYIYNYIYINRQNSKKVQLEFEIRIKFCAMCLFKSRAI